MRGIIMKNNVLLKLTDWQAQVLDYFSHKTGMNYTEICRWALNDLIQKKLTGIDFKTIESVTDRELWDAWEEWEKWDKELKKMPVKKVREIKQYVWMFLREMKKEKQYPSDKPIYLRSGGFQYIDIHHEIPQFHWFFNTQWDLFKEIDIIPYDKSDEEFDIQYENQDLSTEELNDYYNKKWNQYGEILTDKTAHIRNPKLQKLNEIMSKNHFITERELNLYLLDQLEKKDKRKKKK
jgi:hypothetical protein